MSTFANQFKAEISRLAKKELRGELQSLRQASSVYRSEIAALKKRVAALEAQIGRPNRLIDPEVPVVLPDLARQLFKPSVFGNFRKKLGLSAAEMGKLLGVSYQSVYLWENGKTTPQRRQLQRIAELRTMNKKQILHTL